MKQLLIVGARGFGREVYSLATNAIGYNTEFVIKGFLDDKKDALEGFVNYPAILGNVEDYIIEKEDVFICALGSVKWKKYYIEIILAKGGSFINIISPSVLLRQNAIIGRGCIICEQVIISTDVIINDFVTIHPYANFGHDVKIGKYVNIGAYCFFGGFAVIEEEVTLYVRSTILDRLTVSKNAVVGAGSLVVKNVKAFSTVFGNPAKTLNF